MLTRELATGSRDRYEHTECERFLEECEAIYDLPAFDAAVNELVATTRVHAASLDRHAGPRLHAALPNNQSRLGYISIEESANLTNSAL